MKTLVIIPDDAIKRLQALEHLVRGAPREVSTTHCHFLALPRRSLSKELLRTPNQLREPL